MKTILLGLALGVFGAIAPTAQAATLADVNGTQVELNHGDLSTFSRSQVGTILQKRRMHSMKCVYDYSVSGGAIGAISLLDELGKACKLPNKAVIRDVLIDVVTAPVGAGGVLYFGAGVSTTNLKNLTGVSSFTGLVAGTPIGTAATAIKLTADQTPIITISSTALTAGKVNVHIQFQISE